MTMVIKSRACFVACATSLRAYVRPHACVRSPPTHARADRSAAVYSPALQYKFSDDRIIPPDCLREALHDLSSKSSAISFRLGKMADADEALVALLEWLHGEQVGLADLQRAGSVACAPMCISHKVFGVKLCDIRHCKTCDVFDTQPISSTSYTYCAYADQLIEYVSPRRALEPLSLGTLFFSRSCRSPPHQRHCTDPEAQSKVPKQQGADVDR